MAEIAEIRPGQLPDDYYIATLHTSPRRNTYAIVTISTSELARFIFAGWKCRATELVSVVPIGDDGVGTTHILERGNVDAWVASNAAELLAQGYLRLLVTDYVSTRVDVALIGENQTALAQRPGAGPPARRAEGHVMSWDVRLTCNQCGAGTVIGVVANVKSTQAEIVGRVLAHI